MWEINPLVLLGIVSAVAGSVAFLWARVNASRDECLAAVRDLRCDSEGADADLRQEVEAKVVRIHDRQDKMQESMVSKADLDAIRTDVRQLGDRISALNDTIYKLISAYRAAE